MSAHAFGSSIRQKLHRTDTTAQAEHSMELSTYTPPTIRQLERGCEPHAEMAVQSIDASLSEQGPAPDSTTE